MFPSQCLSGTDASECPYPNTGRRYHTYFGTDKSLIPADELEKDRYVLGLQRHV